MKATHNIVLKIHAVYFPVLNSCGIEHTHKNMFCIQDLALKTAMTFQITIIVEKYVYILN